MRGLLFISVLLTIFLGAAVGCTSRQPSSAPDQPNRDGDLKGDAGGGDDSSAQGFATPEASLDAYGKALLDGNGDAYRKIAAKDDKAVKGLDAIIQFEKDMSPEEAARINLQAMAPNQGFGNAVAKRFPAEINGGDAIIMQLFEREIALKTEIHFRKFKFSKSGDRWYLVGSEFGDASTLPAKYAWNKEAEAKVAGSSAWTPISFVPRDALAALVINPKRAASSEIGQSLLKLDVVQAGLRQSHFKPDDIERIIHAMGIPSDESENDCTIVSFMKPMSPAALLKEEFGELAYDEVRFAGQAYYRYASDIARGDGSDLRPETTEPNQPTRVENSKVLAKYPDDGKPDDNGHADGSDSGNWIYLSSDKQNPSHSDARIAKLAWNPKASRYEGNELRVKRQWPAIGRSLAPALKGPQYPVLRWESRTSAALMIHGTFKAIPGAKSGDGVRVLVFVDGRQEFAMDVKRGDTTGVAFDVSASVKPGSIIDFVVDPKADVGYDSTLLDVTIEDTNASVKSKKASPTIAKVLAKYPDDKRPAANGHADSSGSGNWFYYSSRSQDPSDDPTGLTELRWVGSRNRYESPRGAMGNTYPAIGGSLAPGPRPPKFAALRWRSNVSGEIIVRGNFHKFDTASQSDGVRVLVFVNGEQKFAEDVAKKDTVGVDFEIAASIDPDSFVDFVVDPKGRSSDDSTKLTVTIESRGDAGSKPAVEVVEAREPEPTVDDGTEVLLDTAVYFPDDKTMIITNERQLRALISSKPSPSPLTKKLAETGLDHDLIAVVALDGFQDKAADLLLMLAEGMQSAELGGLSGLPKHARSAVVTLDLSGDKLFEITLAANNAASAKELEGGLDDLFTAAEGFVAAIPPDNSVHGLIKQLLQDARLATNGSEVVVTVPMPTGLVEFVKNDPAPAIMGLAALAAAPDKAPPSEDPGVPKDDHDAGEPKTSAYRPPPKDHPEFRDLAVESLDCRVYFPGKPEFNEENVKIAEGNIHVANFQGLTRRATYVFEIYTYPKAFVTKTGAKPLLVQTRDNLVDAPRGRLISSTPNTVRDLESLDFVYEHPETTGAGQGHCRIVIRGNRVYVLEVDGFKVPPADITFFHDSLAPFALATGGTARPETVEKPKLPPPDEAARAAALKLVREVYKSKFDEATTSEAKSALAAAMIDDSAGIDDPRQRFVMLDVARRIAVALPEVATTFKTIDQLDAEFQIESVSLKIQSLIVLSKSRIAAKEQIEFVDRLVEVAEQAIAGDAFDGAVELLTLAQTHARQARELVLVRQITERLNEAKTLVADFSALGPTLKALKDNPTDPAASLVIGRFRCFGQGNWQLGLALLGQCSDARLKMLAQADLAAPAASAGQIAVGDRWWDLAAEHQGLFQKQIRQRAAHWYRLAQAGVTGLEKKKLDSRLEEVTPVGIPPRSVDFLKLIDLRKHVVKGNWKAYRGTLVSPEDSAARVVIPFDPPTEYDLTIVVERKTKDNHFALGLTVDGVLTFVLFDYRNSSRTALFSSPQLGYTNPVFTNNKQATIVASVRKGSLTVSADGNEILNWHGQSQLAPASDPDWRVPDEAKLFIGTSSSVFQIHRIEVTPHR